MKTESMANAGRLPTLGGRILAPPSGQAPFAAPCKPPALSNQRHDFKLWKPLCHRASLSIETCETVPAPGPRPLSNCVPVIARKMTASDPPHPPPHDRVVWHRHIADTSKCGTALPTRHDSPPCVRPRRSRPATVANIGGSGAVVLTWKIRTSSVANDNPKRARSPPPARYMARRAGGSTIRVVL